MSVNIKTTKSVSLGKWWRNPFPCGTNFQALLTHITYSGTMFPPKSFSGRISFNSYSFSFDRMQKTLLLLLFFSFFLYQMFGNQSEITIQVIENILCKKSQNWQSQLNLWKMKPLQLVPYFIGVHHKKIKLTCSTTIVAKSLNISLRSVIDCTMWLISFSLSTISVEFWSTICIWASVNPCNNNNKKSTVISLCCKQHKFTS